MKKIMIVDDDKSLLQEMKTMLSMSGYDVFELDDAAAAVMTGERVQPDVIFLDMKMPGKSGFQIADDLKHFPATSDIPIIAMTGYYTEPQHKKFMITLGINDCVEKPFSHSTIIEKIEKLSKVPGKGHQTAQKKEIFNETGTAV